MLALAIALLAVTSCDWPQFRAAANHGGYVPDDAVKSAAAPGLVQRWAATTGAAVQSSPAIAAGVAYVGSDDGSLYAYDATTGAPKWSVPTGGAVVSSPAVANGTVYVGSDDHKLHAIRLSDHVEIWSATLDNGFAGVSSAPMVQTGVIYAASATTLYAYKANGTKLWSVPVTAAGPLSSPSAANGLIYVSSYADAAVWAYQETGALAWSTTVPGPLASCPASTSGPMVNSAIVYVTLCPSTAPALRRHCSPTGPIRACRSGPTPPRSCPPRRPSASVPCSWSRR